MRNKDIIKVYEKISESGAFDIIKTGRYAINRIGYVNKLSADIVDKLDLQAEDVLLDLGCNIGIYHLALSKHVKKIIGVDSEIIIQAAMRKNSSNKKVEYMNFDIVNQWPILPYKFSKVLVYSVIHFFDSIDDVDNLLKNISSNIHLHGKVMLGEVRTKAKYEAFLERRKQQKHLTVRDMKFMLNKFLNKIFLKKMESFPCSCFKSEDIIAVAEKNGFKIIEVNQQSFHPFYNTCSDFILTKNNN